MKCDVFPFISISAHSNCRIMTNLRLWRWKWTNDSNWTNRLRHIQPISLVCITSGEYGNHNGKCANRKFNSNYSTTMCLNSDRECLATNLLRPHFNNRSTFLNLTNPTEFFDGNANEKSSRKQNVQWFRKKTNTKMQKVKRQMRKVEIMTPPADFTSEFGFVHNSKSQSIKTIRRCVEKESFICTPQKCGKWIKYNHVSEFGPGCRVCV